MKRNRLLVIVILALLLAVVIALWPASIDPNSTPIDGDSGAGAPASATPLSSPAPEMPADGSINALRQQVDNLTLALQAVGRERELAEAELQQSEDAVAELERFVEQIEARGEDPVDYADEGLELFAPAFDQYQRAAERLEIAEALELETQQALTQARGELQRRLAEQDAP